MIRILLVAIALGPLAVSFQANQSPPGSVAYIALGDSIAAGIGSSLPRERSYPALLGDYMKQYLEAPVMVENLAQPGETAGSFVSGEQRSAFEDLVPDLSARSTGLVVTLSLGGNEMIAAQDASDEAREEALEVFQSSYPEALDVVLEIVADEAQVFVSTVYDPTGGDPDVERSESWWIDRFNTVIWNEANERDIQVVDVAGEFGRAAVELTRYPIDPHPTNDGHARIASTHWAAIGLDTEAPQIDVLSSNSQTRRTPTVRFRVSEAIDRQTLTIEVSSDAVVYGPVEIAEREYAMLIDASDISTDSLDLTISVSDPAGNRTETTLALEFDISQWRRR